MIKNKDKILHFFQKAARFNFGEFEIEEFKKFLRMGAIFALIIGVYWTLRPLKDAIFIQLVGGLQLPYAKTVSLIALFPLVMFYSRLLEKTSKEKMLMILPTFYGFLILGFSFIIMKTQIYCIEQPLLSTSSSTLTKMLGYIWYLFIESYGSLMGSLFWAFAASTTEPSSAKRGFPLVVAIGQFGGVVLPYGIGGLPYRIGCQTDGLSILCLGLLVLFVAPLVRYFIRNTPKNMLHAYHGKNENAEIKDQPSGLLEGLKLLFKHKYLLAIFSVYFFTEVVLTICDFNFKMAASLLYSGVALSSYLSAYGSAVNIVTVLSLILGINNIPRFLGITPALCSIPIVAALALAGFLSFDTLPVLFAMMVMVKAVNYSLGGPAMKQLYIPTTPDVRFKAQAWIETFGSRFSKQGGSSFNMLLAPMQQFFGEMAGRGYYLLLAGLVGAPFVIMAFLAALYLGRCFKKAVKNHTTIC
jgi:AAA family ATP:ADP antiporter